MKIKVALLFLLSLTFIAATTYPGESKFGGTVSFLSADEGAAAIKSTCVTDAVDSGAGTQVLTAVIPARVETLGVTCKVNTVIAGAGAASFALGDGTDADLYGTGLAFAAGTTVGTANYTAKPSTQAWSTSARNLTMTANAGQFDSGNITCCSHYYELTGPTS